MKVTKTSNISIACPNLYFQSEKQILKQNFTGEINRIGDEENKFGLGCGLCQQKKKEEENSVLMAQKLQSSALHIKYNFALVTQILQSVQRKNLKE